MINKCILVGNVGGAPKINTLDNGTKKASFSLATSKSYKTKQGEKKQETQWHNIVCFGKLVDVIEKYVDKGNKLYLEGEITYNEYEKDGVKKYFTTIICVNMTMLGGDKKESTPQPVSGGNTNTDDLPF